VKAKVAERGQVTIPKALRDQMGIRAGTVLEFSEEQGRLIAVKEEPLDAIDRFYGKLGLGRRTKEVIQELRGSR
jgi:AbrB family looped-hinge helix DNA binding protein